MTDYGKEALFTLAQVADYFHVHPNTIHNWRRRGEIPFVKMGGRYYLKKEVLEEHISNNSIKPLHNDLISKLKNSIDRYVGLDTVSVKGESSGMNKKISRCNLGVGSVYPRETGKGQIRWYVDYKNSEGKRVQHVIKHAQTQEEAVYALLKEIQEEYDRKYHPEREKEKIKFAELAEMFLQDYSMVAKKSWKTDAYRLEKIKGFFGDVEIKEITPLMIQKFRASRLKEGVEKSTVNREVALLKKMFNVAIEEGYLEHNPAKGIKMYSEMDMVRDRVLTEKEELLLLAEFAEHVKPFAFTSLHTGMRKGELFNLKWQNVDFEKRFIKVERTKSKKVRFIPINSVLYDVFKKLEAERGDSQNVFPFKSIQTAWQNAKRRAGVLDLTFHDLRRTFGTRLLEAEVDIVTISKLYGHSSVLVTQRYLHPKESLSKEAVELLVRKPNRKAENEQKLLHPCDMERDDDISSQLIN